MTCPNVLGTNAETLVISELVDGELVTQHKSINFDVGRYGGQLATAVSYDGSYLATQMYPEVFRNELNADLQYHDLLFVVDTESGDFANLGNIGDDILESEYFSPFFSEDDEIVFLQGGEAAGVAQYFLDDGERRLELRTGCSSLCCS